jgi:peptidoglycan/xylan/chitin deacetylase (PgdA/CDA1 family)
VNANIPILMYHQVTPNAVPASFRKYAVHPDAFRAQMNRLAQLGYTTISLDTLVAARTNSSRLPARPVITTFDDGFRDCVEFAVPILRAHKFTATFFLVAGLIGQMSKWLIAERGVEFALASWEMTCELAASGFECGSHTTTHSHLAQISETACRRELFESRQCLEENLHTSVRHLAYPFGSFNPRVGEIAAEAGYLTACSVQIGLATPNDSRFALCRVPITGYDSPLDFVFRLRTGWRWSEWLMGKKDALARRAAFVTRQSEG